MNSQIKRAAMMGLLVAAAIGLGACLSSQPDVSCGDKRCLDGEVCVLVAKDVSVQTACVKPGDCGNGTVEVGEECDDGNANNGDGCANKCTIDRNVYVKASNTGVEDQLGFSVALSADGSTMAIGAVGEASAAIGIGGDQVNDAAEDAGAVYVFTRSGTTWSQQAYIKASNSGAGDLLGWSVALSADGSTLAVGAIEEDSVAAGIDGDQADDSAPTAGAVYVFTRSGMLWSQQAYVKASNPGAGDRFGWSVALSVDGSTLAVGAPGEDSAATGIGRNQADDSASTAGAVYVFARSGTAWSQQAYVKASNTDAGDRFGFMVALSADGATLAVGAVGEASAAVGIGGNQADQTDNSASYAGAVYVFTRIDATWSQQTYVKASNTDAADEFGWSVALSGDGSTLAVGAIQEASAATGIGGNLDDDSAFDAGAVYVFTRSGATWSQQAYVKASNTDAGDEFGFRVALSANGSTLAVSAPWEASAATGIDGNQVGNQADNSAPRAGAAYVFTRSDTAWSQQVYVKASNTGGEDRFGYSATLSANGSILAVGADLESSAATGIGGDQANNNTQYSGAVYVFMSSAWSI